MSTCAICRHWTTSGREWDEIAKPTDPDTYEPMEMPFEVKVCKHPALLFCERPLETNGFASAACATRLDPDGREHTKSRVPAVHAMQRRHGLHA